MYSVGNRFRIGLFGKSHADCVGCIVSGLPVGMRIDREHLAERMRLRKPSEGIGTPRKEDDVPEFEYGVRGDVIVDDTIMIVIRNGNRNSTPKHKNCTVKNRTNNHTPDFGSTVGRQFKNKRGRCPTQKCSR